MRHFLFAVVLSLTLFDLAKSVGGISLLLPVRDKRTRYSVFLGETCNALTELATGHATRKHVAIDGHVQGPLVGELEAWLHADNPDVEFKITQLFKDCNVCHDGFCTLMGCEYYWHTTLHMRGTPTKISCRAFTAEWTDEEMRMRWRPSLLGANENKDWPFESKEDEGDRPERIDESH
jgi:hypothetical protein